ncbi:hypothetical protein CDL12_29892 [Handroanthus impetiginosus]|uniref:Uncharacterized protein n=1 Tax=Handroanthus impetiginosus TaxID=429701 RepID=A0A2G9FX42_9LAMI|nr:hypothetical protein CDL12_29892 [Handroanthus impetiginosus]
MFDYKPCFFFFSALIIPSQMEGNGRGIWVVVEIELVAPMGLGKRRMMERVRFFDEFMDVTVNVDKCVNIIL